MYTYDKKVNVSQKMKNHPLFQQRIKGMNFGFLSKRGYYEREDVKKQPALMKEMGVNLVTLNLNVCQDTWCSTKLYLDFEYSVGENELIEMAKLLHEQGIMVLFKPCMTCLDGQAMGAVQFPEMGLQIEGVRVDYRKQWFESYTKCIVYCAKLAKKMNAEGFMLGAELLGMEDGYDIEPYWRELIKQVREVYDGAITYEFTCTSRKRYALKWFDELDFLSYSYYPPACPREHINDPENNPVYTQKDMYNFLLDRRQKMEEICTRFDNKPILFTEYGVRSVHGCIQLPYNITFRGKYDGQEQADFMAASFDVFKEVPYWMGLCWWKWDETQHRPHYYEDAAGDGGFTIQGKPAEKVFRETKL